MTKEEIWWSRNPSHDIDDKGEDRFYKTAFMCMEDYARQQAIAFSNWKDKLTPVQRCTVWPPAGSGSGTGLYEKQDEDLYAQFISETSTK